MGTYLLLSLLYAVYLQVSTNESHSPDYITTLVSNQSKEVISSFGYKANVIPYGKEPSIKLYINNQYLANIIEGCNALSIIILFISFVVSFSQNFKKTLLFIFVGTVLIYSINILRIAILAIAIYEYPQYQSFLHGIIFPGLIYGMVFLLWMLWVRMLKHKT